MGLETPDVLVIGVGAMGSATAYHLAKRGVNVVGIDRFAPPHIHGSTHGETRITRQAIGEGAQFVPLAVRSHALWREMERETGAVLFNQCGGLIMAREGLSSHMHGQADFLGSTFAVAVGFGIPHERLSANDIRARFPQFILQGDEVGYFEPGAGYLVPEACVATQLQLAAQHGATLHTNETVLSISKDAGGTVVETDRTKYQAATTIVCAGAWVPQLLPVLAPTLTVRRQVLHWFPVVDDTCYRAGECPIYIWHWGDGPDDVFYGFPQVGNIREIKVATEQMRDETSPDAVNRTVAIEEIDAMYRSHIHAKMRGVGAASTRAATCLYTCTPDVNFVIVRLPAQSDTIVVSACSGHGFKHSAAIGEAVAAMAATGVMPEILLPFQLDA